MNTYIHVHTCIHTYLYTYILYVQGRAIAQAVSLRLRTAAARVLSQVRSREFCGGQTGTEQIFSKYFCILCQLSFHQLLHIH
jgi:hypothetical protein